MFTRITFGAASTFFAALCLLAATAHAEPADPSVRSQRVTISDLDLTTPQARAVLERRVRRAADNVCTSTGIYSVYDRVTRMRCIRQAIQSALPGMALAFDSEVTG